VSWTEIQEFDSPADFRSFRQVIEEAVASGELEPVSVGTPYSPGGFHEEWYREGSGEVWRLVPPDFPFKGVFERVEAPAE
jgi:hypothetical protein